MSQCIRTGAEVSRSICPGAEVSRLFLKTLRHQCRSVSSKLCWCRSVPFFRNLVPKCLKTPAPVPKCLEPCFWCRSVSCESEVSCGRSVLWPKCPVTIVLTSDLSHMTDVTARRETMQVNSWRQMNHAGVLSGVFNK